MTPSGGEITTLSSAVISNSFAGSSRNVSPLFHLILLCYCATARGESRRVGKPRTQHSEGRGNPSLRSNTKEGIHLSLPRCVPFLPWLMLKHLAYLNQLLDNNLYKILLLAIKPKLENVIIIPVGAIFDVRFKCHMHPNTTRGCTS